ncbi:uncharacterized protein [Watersipora subatra]
MGNVDDRDASPILFSTLQEKDTIDDDYIVGAEIHEHKTGRTHLGQVAMRCTAMPAEVAAHTHSDPTIDRVDDTIPRELRAMEDSSFLEPSKQTPSTLEAVDRVKSSKAMSSNEPGEARRRISESLGSNKPCLTKSIKNDCQSGYGEKVPTSVNYPVRLMGAHQHSAELEDNDSIYKTQTAAAHNVNVKLATPPQPTPLENLDIDELSAVFNLENPEELEDLLSISMPLPASAASKRKAFIARRDAQSLPSLAPSLRRLSRSASLRSEQSFEFENFDEKLRTAADGPRMSSLPPTPASGRPTDFFADKKLVESKSFHGLPHVVSHEGGDCHMTLKLAEKGADDGQSLNIVSTIETNLPSDNYDSLSSMDATDAICSCIEEGESLVWDGILVDIAGYVAREWKGKTEKAAAIRKGYGCVINQHQYKQLALIRGDNYCSLRAAYCSMVLNHIRPGIELKDAIPRLEAVYHADPLLFNSWVFPECMIDAATDSSSYHQLSLCLQFFVSHARTLQILDDPVERRRQLFKILNTGSLKELCILEGIKLLMLVTAYELHQSYLAEQEVPVFVWLLFARDTSETVPLLLRNHLNRVGHDAGLDQVEMCLLGYSFGVTLQSFRLYQYGEVDFIALFPEEDCSRPLVPIIAEDDRHYNTPLKPLVCKRCRR